MSCEPVGKAMRRMMNAMMPGMMVGKVDATKKEKTREMTLIDSLVARR